ncbi:aminomethyltransferase family protein [Marinomonas sp. A79]|uniref:Aminomethyltransferase family protein n=2 Tax=Marinomonas vulgaris TaxID=2823372 RepID=A0ABS5H970_9GAMM|nr:aminomethyltransferase family protein [Marinomonas vulgaris]
MEPKERHQVYRVQGQEALRLTIKQGECIEITSPDRQQGCEILLIPESILPTCFTEHPTAPASRARAQLAQQSTSAQQLSTQLSSWGITDAHLESAYCFDANELPNMIFDQATALIVLCCGENMPVDEQQPVTELYVKHGSSDRNNDLPAPLAEVKNEYRVPRCNAVSYQVKAGEWIQIIDVEGRQCSDFVALDYQALQQGKEIILDEVGTRSDTGRSTPLPGIYSKFTDPYQQNMMELVQDTVGRHDTFMYACNAKFYEESGYFGHANCTDNINRVLKPFGVKSRFGWPAINFFFNTVASQCGAIGFAEPYSRAGDYVLVRASRDMLCVSTACPDDIDPSNGWNPTDIHIRIYGAEHDFPRAIGYRLTPEELPRMTKQTGFHPSTSQLTKQFTEYRGYWVASEYDNWGAKAEYLACRERVAMIDLSPLRKLEIRGPDAEDFLQLALTRNVRRVSVGEIVYSAMCHETGGMIDDGTLFRLGEQTFRWVCGDSYGAIWLRELAEKRGFNVSIQESTDQIHNVAVQGPRSRELLQKLIWTRESQIDFVDLKWFHFLIGRLGGPDGIPLMVSRTGYTGELGFEVWCHPDHATKVWDAIWQAGQAFDIAPLGFDALDMLRIEAGLIFAEHEFCPETNPFEAGIGFTTPLKTQQEDFIGRAAIEQQSPASRKKLVGLRLESNDLVHHGDQVFNGRYPVGLVTSSMVSPLLKGQLAMCRVSPAFSEVGTELEIGQLDGQQKRIKAIVTGLPFYDPERTKVRS